MESGQPSRTALRAARLRALHQVLDRAQIFSDPLALRILGHHAEPIDSESDTDLARRRLRFFVAARARFAEDALAAAVSQGLRQVVILGAGLDTYAYRAPLSDGLRIFEVDHPATQAWKRRLLSETNIAVPLAVTFAPIDFEYSTLAGGLVSTGFDPEQRTFVTWLGVAPYLTEQAVLSTAGFFADLEGGAQVVFDYSTEPTTDADGEGSAAHEGLAARAASVGEPFRSAFEPRRLSAQLKSLGFHTVDDIAGGDLVSRYLTGRVAPGRPSRGHVMSAAR